MLKAAIGIQVTLVVVCAGFSPARAVEETELEVDHALTLEVTTPHTDWARPYAQGKTSVLFFTDAEDLRPRECVELMQRFDLEAEAVFWSKIVDSANSHWHGGEQGEARMLRLLDRKWDCFVFLEMGMDKMSEEQQFRLLRQVADGAGLVFVGTDDRRVLKEPNRLPEVPGFLQVENVQAAYSVGTGRGVRLTQRPFLKYAFGWETEYDHWQERLGRAVLWAAGKDPKSSLELTPYQQPGKRNCLRVRLTGTASGKSLSLEATVKREGEVRASIRHQSISVEGPLELALPYFPEGSYHVDARVIGGSGVETWGTTEFRVQASRSVARVDFERDWGEVGGFCKGLVELSGGKLRNEKLQVRLLDRHRREMQRREIASFDSRVPFQFHLKSWMPMLLAVDAVLFSDGKEMSHAWSYFRVTKRNRGRFNLM
ncbi:MAG: hypothetical protein HY318_09195, partial [Armatimonadetes bacterium]|nr:hypothetical protein [Armatimonadota bacterium]